MVTGCELWDFQGKGSTKRPFYAFRDGFLYLTCINVVLQWSWTRCTSIALIGQHNIVQTDLNEPHEPIWPVTLIHFCWHRTMWCGLNFTRGTWHILRVCFELSCFGVLRDGAKCCAKPVLIWIIWCCSLWDWRMRCHKGWREAVPLWQCPFICLPEQTD